MKKIWSYLAVGFLFLSGGIIIGAKWIDTIVFKGKVKIRQRGEGNILDSDIAIDVKDAKKAVKEARKVQRKLRKAKRNDK